jgi:paired amphipathic helix protein Sin3a
MERKQQWQYYIASYMRIEHTEGVDRSQLNRTVLERNLPAAANDASDDGYVPKPLVVHEGLVLRICLNTYHTVYEPGTSEYFIFDSAPQSHDERAFHEDKQVFMKELREEKFTEKMVLNSPWMRNMSREDVSKINEEYQNWVKGTAPNSESNGEVAMTD